MATNPPRGAEGAPPERAGRVADDALALARLGGLRLRGALRARLRELRSVRGLVSLLVIVPFVGCAAFVLHAAGAFEPSPALARAAADERVLAVGLVVALAVSVMMSSGPALHFSPAEMNLLFSAPVRRGSLVLYKLLSYTVGAVLSGALVAALASGSAVPRAQLFVAAVTTLVFVQSASALVSMGGLLARRRLRSRAWRAAPPALAAALALGIGARLAAGDASPADAVVGLSDALDGSAAARVALAPFALFGGLWTPAASPLAFAARLALALALLALVFAAIVRLEASLGEETTNASLAAHARWRRILEGGSVWRRGVGTLRSRRAPRGLAGAVPLGWSRALAMRRTSGRAIGWLLALAVVSGAALGALTTVSNAPEVGAAVFFALVFVLPRVLVFDFRGAPRTIELTRTLPVPPWAVCLGQLATPVATVVALQWVAILTALAFAEPRWTAPLIALGTFLMPLALLHYALENLLFLLAPTRLVPVGRVDFDFLGRTLLEFLVKCALLAIAVGAAIAAGLASLSIRTGAWPQAAGVATATLSLAALLGFALLTIAYARLDGARRAPG